MNGNILEAIYQMTDSERLRLLCHLARRNPELVCQSMARPGGAPLLDCATGWRISGAPVHQDGAPESGAA